MTLQYIDADGGRLAFDVAGQGPLVICSPAMGDMRDAYAPLASSLVSSGYRVACIDLRGHGESSATFNRYGDEAAADDMLAVVERLGGGPAVLAGASMSAAAAVIAAGRRPELISGLMLFAPFLRNGMDDFGRKILHFALTKPWGPPMWRFYSAKLWPGLGPAAKQRASTTTASLNRPGRWPAFHATTNTDHRVVAPWIGKVKAPVLVVMGDADPDWKDPLAEANWAASNFNDAEVVSVPGAGHAPMLERPHVVTPEVIKFLRKANPAPLHQ